MLFYKSKYLVNSEWEKDSHDDIRVTLTDRPTRFGKFFGFKEKSRVFVGGCTVYFEETKNGLKRASTSMEYLLLNVWEGMKRKSKKS